MSVISVLNNVHVPDSYQRCSYSHLEVKIETPCEISDQQNVMILCHPESTEQEERINKLCHSLQKNGFSVDGFQNDTTENWRDFAEMAGEKYYNIVFFASEKLCDLCLLYKNMECLSEQRQWEKLLSERHKENVPCVALDHLRCLYQDRKYCFKFHIVFFNHCKNYEKLRKKFDAFLEHQKTFLVVGENTFIHSISEENLDSVLPMETCLKHMEGSNSVVHLINKMREM